MDMIGSQSICFGKCPDEFSVTKFPQAVLSARPDISFAVFQDDRHCIVSMSANAIVRDPPIAASAHAGLRTGPDAAVA